MKFIHSNTLCIEFSDLAECGFDAKNVSSYISKGYRGWLAVDDPDDRRRTLIPYEQMTDAAKMQIEQRFGNVYQYMRVRAIKGFIKADSEAFKFYSTYQLPDGSHLPNKHITAYVAAAEWLNMLVKVSKEKRKFFSALGMESKREFYDAAISLIKAENVELPHNYVRLMEKLRKYEATGYRCLISGKFGNDNSLKITDEIGKWLIAQYQLPTKIAVPMLALKYLGEAQTKGWEPVTEQAIHDYLHKPENMQKWYGGRHGFRAASEEFGYSLRTKMPTFRDALWYSDGTGLNYVGQKDGKWLGMHNIYWIIDAYSEMVIGWHVSKTENYDAQIKATQMAVRNAMAKPHEWRYDNQGGHKKSETQEFFDKVATHHFNTQPYNGKSKTIENLTYRFQSQVMRQDWFFSGQNRTAKKLDSKANMEFVLENLKQAPTLEQIIETVGKRIEEWNNAKHHESKLPRKQMYFESVSPKHQPIDYLELVELFWLTTANPITYRNDGIKLTIAKKEYEFEVLKDGMPDTEFRAKYIGERFYVKYDNDDLSHVRLYVEENNSLRFVSMAEPRIIVPRALVDHQEGDAAKIQSLLQVRRDEAKRMKEESKQLEEETGIRREDLITSYGEYTKSESFVSDESLYEFVPAHKPTNINYGKKLD